MVVDAAIRRWEGTRYMSGQQVRGVHADCVRFGCGVLDDLYGRRRELPPNLALDAAMHAPAKARAQLRALLSIYPEAELRPRGDDGCWDVEPADVVVAGQGNSGPGHLILVGAEPNTCWEAPSPGQSVRKIGIGLHPGTRVRHVYRMRDRLDWLGKV